jgi:hypothetical protein
MNFKYFIYQTKMFIMFFIILTVLNSGFKQFNYDFINFISIFLKNNFNLSLDLEKKCYILAGIFAIIIAINRDTWLPFLGDTVLPASLIPIKNNNGDIKVNVNVKPNTKVAYWSTKPKTTNGDDPDVKNAYDDYSNSGVVKSNKNGLAILTLNKGSGYYVPYGKHIKPHVHYRELNEDMALIGPVKTVYFDETY